MSNFKPQAGARAPGDDSQNPGATTGNFLAELRSGAPESEFSVPAGPVRRRRFSVQSLIVGAVVVASIGLLYVMRLTGMGSGMTFETVKIDYQLDGPHGVNAAEQRRILADLERSGTPMQIPAEKLDKNPFELRLDVAVTPTTSVPAREAPDQRAIERMMAELEREKRAARDAAISEALARLELHGVMLGRVPLARINGATVRPGDPVANVFVVRAIHNRTVELSVDGRVFALTMGDPRPVEITPNHP